ncbi:MAG: exo-alpha-sialidase [Bacteroidetes bacterium]|nr:exo-alpha-sialidase [Bacteroidota bacterium]
MNQRLNFFVFGITVLVTLSCKKEGCTDSQAENYNQEAKKDDGSCTYTPDPLLENDFTPPSGPDLTAPDLESPAYFRLLTATSADGLTFTTTGNVVTDQANVPDLIYKDDKLFLYYTGWNMGTTQNATSCAVSADNGQTWAFNHCNFTGFGAGIKPVDPDAILLENGNIRMFATTDISGKRCVLCYESTDGINFTFTDTAAYSSSDHIFDSNTFQLNGQWHMYAANAVNTEHWHLTSSNGINFSVQGSYIFADGTDQHFISNGYVTGSSYRIMSAFNPNQNLKSFTTADGVNWTIDTGYRLVFGGSSSEVSYLKDPAVVKLPDGTYLMVYTTRMI